MSSWCQTVPSVTGSKELCYHRVVSKYDISNCLMVAQQLNNIISASSSIHTVKNYSLHDHLFYLCGLYLLFWSILKPTTTYCHLVHYAYYLLLKTFHCIDLLRYIICLVIHNALSKLKILCSYILRTCGTVCLHVGYVPAIASIFNMSSRRERKPCQYNIHVSGMTSSTVTLNTCRYEYISSSLRYAVDDCMPSWWHYISGAEMLYWQWYKIYMCTHLYTTISDSVT